MHVFVCNTHMYIHTRTHTSMYTQTCIHETHTYTQQRALIMAATRPVQNDTFRRQSLQRNSVSASSFCRDHQLGRQRRKRRSRKRERHPDPGGWLSQWPYVSAPTCLFSSNFCGIGPETESGISHPVPVSRIPGSRYKIPGPDTIYRSRIPGHKIPGPGYKIPGPDTIYRVPDTKYRAPIQYTGPGYSIPGPGYPVPNTVSRVLSSTTCSVCETCRVDSATMFSVLVFSFLAPARCLSRQQKRACSCTWIR